MKRDASNRDELDKAGSEGAYGSRASPQPEVL